MPRADHLVEILQRHRCICYYPSAGTDLSNLDFFGSGKKLWSERIGESQSSPANAPQDDDPVPDPDLFVHTDIQFYREFENIADISPIELGFHGSFEVLSSRELPVLPAPNRIVSNLAHSGRCFEHTVRLWGSGKTKTLIFCLCENEAFVSQVLLDHGIHVHLLWSRNWAGGKTYGTWLPNVLDRLRTSKVYTDWLCIPGQRGEPRNHAVEEHYPELMVPSRVQLVRHPDLHWIVEGAHGWVEEFDVVIRA
jgi:hypothetical protein